MIEGTGKPFMLHLLLGLAVWADERLEGGSIWSVLFSSGNSAEDEEILVVGNDFGLTEETSVVNNSLLIWGGGTDKLETRAPKGLLSNRCGRECKDGLWVGRLSGIGGVGGVNDGLRVDKKLLVGEL